MCKGFSRFLAEPLLLSIRMFYLRKRHRVAAAAKTRGLMDVPCIFVMSMRLGASPDPYPVRRIACLSKHLEKKGAGPETVRRLDVRCAPRSRTTYLHSLAGPKQFMGALDRR